MVGLSTGLGLRTLTNKLIDESNLLKEILEPVTEKLPKSRFYKIFQASWFVFQVWIFIAQ